ncbi:MAG: bifunctional 2-polyprenyl-6-hydroxyphenol methylase/3-demethylubiquinol 3-O-methyltransferase UbiG [Bdellovibrionales bacterium]
MKAKVNNDYYNHLGDAWYDADDDPIAVLRAEQQAKNPWVDEVIEKSFSTTDLKILDVGCGAGFLTNYLSRKYSSVAGLDASESSLKVASSRDITKKVQYTVGNAYQLPYETGSMDVVCAMDFLEHVEKPEDVISECSRVLKDGGLFFFHTFNRNFISWLIVIKFMEWFVPNTPKNLHVLHLFIKPKELEMMMLNVSLKQKKVIGIGPNFNWSFLKSIFARRVLPGFSFRVGGPTFLGFMGYSEKQSK